MPATVILNNAMDREKAIAWIRKAPHNCIVTFKKSLRTPPQNDRMWAMLTDVAQQVTHNGKRYSPEQWKCLFMHACGYEAHFMPGLNGEPFPAGFRTSKMNKEQMTELMDFIDAWGTQNGVRFGDAE